MEETFEEFMRRVDRHLVSVSGMSHDDFTDALWYDLYGDMKGVTGSEFTSAVDETLADADDVYAAILGA